MGAARQCERCGKLYLPYKHAPIKTYEANPFNAFIMVNLNTEGRYILAGVAKDLCPDCMEAFLDFMGGLPE